MSHGAAAKRHSHEAFCVEDAERGRDGKRAKCDALGRGTNTCRSLPVDEHEASQPSVQDDLGFLKRMQKLNAPYDPSLKYVSVRRLLVDFIFDVCEELQLQTVTIHRSVNYLDRLLSKRTDISRTVYQLLATACILVAAKFEEQPTNVPTLNQLANQIEGAKSKARLLEAEKLLLSELGWNALSATTLHFSQCYINLGVHCACDTLDAGPINVRDKAIIERHVESFATFICLQDYSFMQYEQALLAAAGVAAARSICNISPVWPDELAKRLGYSFHDIAKCLDSILSVTKLNSKPSQQPESCNNLTVVAESLAESRCGATAAADKELDSQGEGEAGGHKKECQEGSPRSVSDVLSTFCQRR